MGSNRGPWSERFVSVLESLRMGPQLARGRRYARAGHVRQLTISSSLVVAQVRGADDERAFRARIAVRAFGATEWARVERELAGQAYYAAALLSGRLPDDIDAVFARLGLELFPGGIGELAMDCSCPDWEVPCPHLAAACYVLAGSFDTDPFGILAWRGRGRDELLGRLRELRAPATAGGPDPAPADDLAAFWSAGPVPDPPAVTPRVPGTVRRADAVLEELDPLPLTLGRHPVTDLLRPAYRAIGG